MMRYDFSFLYMKNGEGNITIVKVYFQMFMQISFFTPSDYLMMNLITPEMIILFRPCPVLTPQEPQQPFRQSIKIQAVLFITLSGLSLLPKIHSKLVCFVPEPEN